MTYAIKMHQAGGPEVLQWEEVEVGDPGPGQVRLKQEAAGLMYTDCVNHGRRMRPRAAKEKPRLGSAGRGQSRRRSSA